MPVPGIQTFCSVHGAAPTAARCALCGRSMCTACARFLVNDSPSCTLCAYVLSTRKQRRITFALLLSFITIAGMILAWPRFGGPGHDESTAALVIAAIVTVISSVLLLRGAEGDGIEIVSCTPEDLPEIVPQPVRARPMRTATRRFIAFAAPPLSARLTVLAIVIASGVIAVATPRLLALPRVVEIEIVLALVLVLLAVTFAVLLFRGYRLEDDHIFVAPALPWDDGLPEGTITKRRNDHGKGCEPSGCDGGGCDLAEGGFLVVLGVGLVLLVALAITWAVVELILPITFLAIYEVLVFGLRRVANDRHGCEGDLVASIGWGSAWALFYVVPIGLVVAFVHAVRVHAG